MVEDLVKNVEPPAHIGSWYHQVDNLVVLQTAWEGELVRRAAEKALGWNSTEKCIQTWEIAARGAALRALDWVEYYMASERDSQSYGKYADSDVYTSEVEDSSGFEL